MNLTIEIPDMLEAALETKAHERGLSGSGYASQVLERDLRPDEPEKNPNELPIWEVISDIMKDVPDVVFDRWPKDGASQVDYYIYGLPKRSE